MRGPWDRELLDASRVDADLDADLDADPVDPDGRAVVRPAARRARHHRRRRLALGAAAAVGLAALVGVARGAAPAETRAGTTAATADETGDGPAVAPPVAEEVFPALVDGPAPGADYPEAAVVAARDVVPGTARLLGRDGDLVFWVARDGDASVCLLVRAGGEPLRVGGACSSAVDAAAHGVALPEGDGVRAVLVPAGLDSAGAARLVGPGLEEVAPSLWVGRAPAAPP